MKLGGRKAVLTAIAILIVFIQPASAADLSTVTSIGVEGNGDAHWTVQNRILLETDADREAFREVRGSDAAVEFFRLNMEGVIAEAANVTGRDMSLSNFSAESRIEGVTRSWGVVVYSFEWSNFSKRGDDTLITSGLISGYNLAESDRLTISGPPGSKVEEVDPVPDVRRGGRVSWRGPQGFEGDEPKVVIRLDVEGNATGPGAGKEGRFPTYPVVAVAAALLVAAFLLLLRRRRSGNRATLDSKVPDAELVLQILAGEGGRMRQADLVDRTGWSASKVSRVTKRLEESGRLDKRRRGKEKVLVAEEAEE